MFVDITKIRLAAGIGGNGKVSFSSSRGNPKGGPDGGDGGSGGNIIVRADHNSATLSKYRTSKLWKAEDGTMGGSSRRHGRNGHDLVLHVAPGTVVMDGDNVIADLSNDGDEAVIAKGGRGGFGNAHFVSSTRQTPRMAELGEEGEQKEYMLELKLVADVGLIGLPNAGKSTLLSVLSNARPQIADYPFTTLVPNLGIMEGSDSSIVLADIPGLIEGAAEGKGLGDEFLRHVERTRVLLHLIDSASDDVVTAYKVIQGELKNYQIDLSDRPQIVALSKAELVEPAELKKKRAELAKTAKLKQAEVLVFSAQTHVGLDELKGRIMLQVSRLEKQSDEKVDEEVPTISLKQDGDFWSVTQDDTGAYVVSGASIERFAAQTNFDQYQAVNRLRDILNKKGITHELERQGCVRGKTVLIGKRKLTW